MELNGDLKSIEPMAILTVKKTLQVKMLLDKVFAQYT